MNNQIAINVSGAHGLVPYTYKTVVLKPNVVDGKNILTQLMMGQTNTKYVIKYDYVIDPDIQTGIASVSESNISHCVNPNYAAALAAYNLAHDAWIDADNAYTNNPNDTTLAAKNAAYATYTAAQTTLNNTPQYYYYAAKAISLHKGQYISIPDDCVLLNNSLNGLAGFEIAPNDIIVYIGSLIPETYEYTVQNAIQIPARCLIEFDGGSISDGALIGDETILIFDQEEEVVLKNVELLGTFEYSAGGSGGVDKKDNVDGMATITLKKNKSFASQLTQTNTIYRIMYDFDLGGETVTIPENCVLEFDGGSISNGVLTGQNTVIGEDDKVRIFGDDLSLAGTWNVKEGYPEWFGCVPDDNTIDTTPAIQKFVAVAIPVVFGDGTWYLSECLLQGRKNVNIKGTSTHYETGTILKAFNATGQRFIMKLGGLADFGKPSDYYAVWCSNFVLDGINFNTNGTTFVNANPSMGQNYAAVCFDWCVEGYVNVRHEGSCPAVFVANTWEVYFESITCYGSYTRADESAVYFGKAYTDVVASNISAVTINNLFGECIFGKFVDVYGTGIVTGANIADLIINNIEFEPGNALPSNKYSHKGQQAYAIIENNIRNMSVRYYFNLSGSMITIGSIACCLNSLTFEDDTVAAGLIKTTTSGTRVSVGGVYLPYADSVANIYGAEKNSSLTIYKAECEPYTNKIAIYTDTLVLSDFSSSSIAGGYLPIHTGDIRIINSNIIIDKDIVKIYNAGLLFNTNNFNEVSSAESSNDNSVKIVGEIEGIKCRLLYFRSFTLGRKFRFNGQKLSFRYIASQGGYGSITINYYKGSGASPIHTDSITPAVSDTKIQTHEYTIYSDSYDYCTIGFNRIFIESVEVVSEQEAVVEKGSSINSEVLSIMSHYSRDDAYKRTALKYFLNKIGDIKDKLNHLILPIFANNIDEAIYDIVADSPFYNAGGTNYLAFNKTTRRVYLTITEEEMHTWHDINYALYSTEEGFEGALVILSATDYLGTGVRPYNSGIVNLNSADIGYYIPSVTGNKKIIGAGIVSHNNEKYIMRLADTDISDKLTAMTERPTGWERYSQIFGQKPTDTTRGVRILVSTDQLLTDEEAKTLRDAVIELDDKFAVLDEVNDNFTPALESSIIPKSGTFANRPTIADYVIPVGFAYFCTDKQTEEGAADGIMIYYKGQDTTDPDNPVDIWVDALGRVVS